MLRQRTWKICAALTAITLSAAGCRADAPRVAPSVVSTDAGAPAVEPAARTPFVVAIEVDQLSAWVAATRLPALPEDGGFARLMREGTWVKSMRYPYAVTDTAPGHAALHTGKTPSETGIFGNEIPGPGGTRLSILRDASTRIVTPDGEKAKVGSSAARLLVPTVADQLRRAHPDALITSISLKDRGAIMPAGRAPTHALWFDIGNATFITSTAFSRTFPDWARAAGDPSAVAAARAKPWTLTDEAWVQKHAASADDAPGEGDLEGFGTTFPHLAKTAAGFRALPASDEAIFDLALASVAAEYDRSKPTLLLLSMSASDVVGHTFGPDSWEAWDYLRKLDASLGRFLAALEAKVGPVDVMLSADHGNVSMPEARGGRQDLPACKANRPDPWGRPCDGGTRLPPAALVSELAKAAATALGPGSWIDGVADPYVFLTAEARALPADRRAKLDVVLRKDLAKRDVAEVFDARYLAAACPERLARAAGIPARAAANEDLLTLVCRSWPSQAGAGDYYVVPRLGSFFDAEIVVGKGTSHGTPYLHDRTIPLFVRAARTKGAFDAGAVIEAPVDFTAFAAVEAALLGLGGDARASLEAATAR